VNAAGQFDVGIVVDDLDAALSDLTNWPSGAARRGHRRTAPTAGPRAVLERYWASPRVN
jgi:hypothetical protein